MSRGLGARLCRGGVYEAQDRTGCATWYVFNSVGYLTKFYDANGGLTAYAYDSSNRMVSYTTPNGNVQANNYYDLNSRVILQIQPDGEQYGFTSLLDGNNNVTETDMTGPIGSTLPAMSMHRSTVPSGRARLAAAE